MPSGDFPAGIGPETTRGTTDSLYGPKPPKILWTVHPMDAYGVVVPGAINSGYMSRIRWPETGTIDRIAIFCIATGAGNIDLGVYDTTATTRNRLVNSGSVALVANSWVAGTVSLPVKGGDFADLAFGVDNATASVACVAAKHAAMSVLPSGWYPVPLGGSPRLNGYVSTGFFTLPLTIAEASMANDLNYPLIMARYT